MGKLTHLRDQKPQPLQLVEGIIGAIGADIARTLKDAIGSDIAAQGYNVALVRQAVDKLAADVEKALVPAVKEAVESLRPELTQLTSELKSRAITQGDMVALQGDIIKALGRVKIPDYSAALKRIEAREVDLGPLLEKLDNLVVELPEDERPTEWTFDIKRDRNGLIETVTARAE